MCLLQNLHTLRSKTIFHLSKICFVNFLAFGARIEHIKKKSIKTQLLEVFESEHTIWEATETSISSLHLHLLDYGRTALRLWNPSRILLLRTFS